MVTKPKGIAVLLGVLLGLVFFAVVIGGVVIFKGKGAAPGTTTNTNGALQLSCTTDADCSSYCGGDVCYQPICGVTVTGAVGTCACRSTCGPLAPTTNTSGNTNAKVNTNTAKNTNTTKSENKTYTSAKFGISFTYAPTYGDKKVLVKETSDTIYVYVDDGVTSPEEGQFVRMFTKSSSTTFKAAIERQFLKGYAATDCFVEESSFGLDEPWVVSEISFPPVPEDVDDKLSAILERGAKCPKGYVKTNGLRYFAYHPSNPTKFYFFSIGQYTIPANSASVGVKGWEKTVALTSPTTANVNTSANANKNASANANANKNTNTSPSSGSYPY